MLDVESYLGNKSRELSGKSLEEILNGSYQQESQEFLNHVNNQGMSINPDMAFYQKNDVINSALVASGEKEGMMVRATLSDRSLLHNQIEALNNIGLDCYVVPETIVFEREEMGNSAIYVTNNRNYRNLSVDELPFSNGEHEDDEGLGEFFGYPEPEIEAFLEHGMWPNGFTYESGKGRPIDYEPGTEYVFPAHILAREHGRDERTINKLHSFVNYAIRDDPEAVEKAVDKAESRYGKLQEIEEEYGLDSTTSF